MAGATEPAAQMLVTAATVIIRRKRVPATPGASPSTNTSPAANTRLTEQAAAEALVSVSRAQERASGEDSDGPGADDDDDGDGDEPRRKRVRRGANGNAPASLAKRRSARTKVSTRKTTPEDKDEEGDDADTGSKRRRKGTQRDILLAESRAGNCPGAPVVLFFTLTDMDEAALPTRHPSTRLLVLAVSTCPR
jgi:hypothetical protein